MPTMAQVSKTMRIVETMRARLEGVLVIDYVPADYYATYPKACMGGWGRAGFNVPFRVRYCRATPQKPLRTSPLITSGRRPLGEIGYDGSAFNAFRGDGWMPELCKSCERKDIDFGGCRCQAVALVGDASATDPVCFKSPHRHAVDHRVVESPPPSCRYRRRYLP
jgi:pyrroloquinoline quinone biosynthesis protein E